MTPRFLINLGRYKLLLGLISVFALVFAACGSDEATAMPAATSAMPAATSAPAATTAPAATAVPAAPTAVPTVVPAPEGYAMAGAGGVPESVDKFTIAVDGWGWDDLNPVQMQGVTFLQDYFNVFLLMRDEDHEIVSGLAIEWELSDEGFGFTIHPDAIWQDGSPITSADIKWNYEASRGDFSPDFTGHLSANRFKEQIQEVEMISDKEVFIRTVSPSPDFIAFYSGSGYHQVHVGHSAYLQEVGVAAFEEKPSGGRPIFGQSVETRRTYCYGALGRLLGRYSLVP